jgi:ElaA protein
MAGLIRWTHSRFEELTADELYRILDLRQRVFVVEQRCPYLDTDGRDRFSYHLCGWNDEGHLCAYLRIVQPGRRFVEPSIGRVVTDPSVRGQGLGKELMRRGMEWCGELYPGLSVRISAQQYLERFYADLGFVTDPVLAPYDDDGIIHVEMLCGPGT